ncbi:MAG TPA: hypothetical protein VKE96_02940 [Vicinamibacterales bacterium]|nr:hypothetical protein [Vicinamibacterales bacterium]
MLKITFGVIAGLVAWILLVTLSGLILRAAWPAYAAVAESMAFTLPMLVARLAISAVTLLAAARITAFVAPKARTATLLLGAILLVAFVPIHINLWNRFPAWYHVTFLLTLIPLSVLGGRLGRMRRTGTGTTRFAEIAEREKEKSSHAPA